MNSPRQRPRAKWLFVVAAVAFCILTIRFAPDVSQASADDIARLARAGQVEGITIGSDGAVAQIVDGSTTAVPLKYGQRIEEVLHSGGLTGAEIAAIPVTTTSLPVLAAPAPLVPAHFLVLAVVAMFALLFVHSRGQAEEKTPSAAGSGRGTAAAITSIGARKLAEADRPATTFADVAGVDEAIEELREVVAFLREPERFATLGAHLPKGALLVGPPGTGKTLLARAVAGEAGVPFFSICGSEFVEVYVGVGAARVRDLFAQARKSAPCIVFFDELDAVGRKRSEGALGVNEEREQTLNQILVEVDGFAQSGNVVVLAATNRPDVLDPALLRPGRFDRRIAVDAPDRAGRERILAVHARGKPLDESVDLTRIAALTPGFTGADLANLLNEAAIVAGRASKTAIGMYEVELAVDRVTAGPERKGQILSPAERLIIAYHEAGHALVARALQAAGSVHKVSIVARGASGGQTQIIPPEDRRLWSRSQLEATLAAVLGGRAAEELGFGEATSGAENDLQKATSLAQRMVARLGMSDGLGLVTVAIPEADQLVGYGLGDYLARRVHKEVDHLTGEAYRQALAVLTRERALLDAVATALLEKDTLSCEELEEICTGAAAM